MSKPKKPLAKKRAEMKANRKKRAQARQARQLAAHRTSKGYKKFGGGATQSH